jgi:photosystem II stability/assembly factor-like uncharacterized protein
MNLISKVLPSIPRKVFGEVWTAQDNVRRWEKVAMSGTGQHQLALTSTIGSDLRQLYVSSDYGTTWTAKEPQRQYRDIRLSYKGEVQIALEHEFSTGRIYVSTDFGNTWAPKGPDLSLGGLFYFAYSAISLDGQVIIAATGDRVFRSFDFGETWSQSNNAPWVQYGYGAITGISASSNCQNQVILADNNIVVSSDYGATWSTSKLFRRDALQPVISSSGQIQILFGKETQFQTFPQINASTDFGNTWVKKEYITTRAWKKLVISADGTRAAGLVGWQEIFVSNDSANTWVNKFTLPVRDGLSFLQMSSDGKILIAGNVFEIFVSTDFGENWALKYSEPTGSDVLFTDAKLSFDGTRATAARSSSVGGRIYTAGRTRI